LDGRDSLPVRASAAFSETLLAQAEPGEAPPEPGESDDQGADEAAAASDPTGEEELTPAEEPTEGEPAAGEGEPPATPDEPATPSESEPTSEESATTEETVTTEEPSAGESTGDGERPAAAEPKPEALEDRFVGGSQTQLSFEHEISLESLEERFKAAFEKAGGPAPFLDLAPADDPNYDPASARAYSEWRVKLSVKPDPRQRQG
jgi:hypothetical protein